MLFTFSKFSHPNIVVMQRSVTLARLNSLHTSVP